MKILDGKAVSLKVKESVKVRADELKKFGVEPTLAVVLVGEDKASQTYVRAKEKACNEYGIKSVAHRLSENTTQNELLALINVLNLDDSIHGILVQLPLPNHINEMRILLAIDPKKDVDGFHPINVGKMLIGLPTFVSATPLGILTLLSRYGISTSGKKCVVMGRSNIVGKPMVQLMLQKEGADCTVTCVHSHTENVAEECRTADILIAALGQPEFVKADMVKPGAVVVDVGTTRVPDPSRANGYRLSGDVDFSAVSQVASAITPVPGGVGPMTICMLMRNTLEAAKQRRNISIE